MIVYQNLEEIPELSNKKSFETVYVNHNYQGLDKTEIVCNSDDKSMITAEEVGVTKSSKVLDVEESKSH